MKTKKRNSICAPFVTPAALTKSPKMSKRNLNIIKTATSHSCFSIESLRNIADKWNNANPTNKIKYTTKTGGKQLWSLINAKMSDQCTNEYCWVKQEFIKNSPLARQLIKNFKPIMPKSWSQNKYEWLDTLNIRDVMNQYEIKYSDFEFIGPVPMDFDTVLGFGQCVVNELCKVDLAKLVKLGKMKLGIVFNLDKHTQSGSHWVAMFLNYDIGDIYYWDSYGSQPTVEVVELMNRLKNQAANISKTLNIKINKIRHQYKNSECGVYCIYFITSLLAGKKFEDVTRNIVNDDKMNAKRGEFFAVINE